MKMICLLFLLPASVAVAQTPEIEEAQAMYEDYWQLYNAQDFDSLGTYWHDDVHGFIANHTPFLLEGKDEFSKLHNDLRNVSFLNMTLEEPRYTAFEDDVVTCSSYYTWRIASSEGFEIISGRHTALLVKTEDGWKLASMHFSKIFPN